jgi:hypothetical protein
MIKLLRISPTSWLGVLQIYGVSFAASLILIALIARRRAKLKELNIAGIQIIPRRVAPRQTLARARQLSLRPDSIGVRIAIDLVEEVLKEDPVNVEAIELRHTLREALTKLGPFEVKIDSFFHARAIKAVATIILVFAFFDLATQGFWPFFKTVATYPASALPVWLVATLVHEYGHFSALRRVLIEQRGVVIPRMQFFSVVNFGDTLTLKGILRLLFLFKADDTKIDVNEVVDTALEQRRRLEDQHARIEQWLRDRPRNT